MSTLYTIHDNKQSGTKVINPYDLLEFLLDNCLAYDFAAADMKFSIDNYGPQMIGGRYLITKHLDSSAY